MRTGSLSAKYSWVSSDSDGGDFSGLREAAEAGNLDAMVSLAGLLRSTDPDQARVWFERAASMGSTKAMFWLGWMSSVVDPATAARWYREVVALNNDRSAAFNLGLLLERVDPESAAEYFEIAANGGHPRALRRLALIKIKSDPAEGWRLLRQAAAQGDRQAARQVRLRVLRPLFILLGWIVGRIYPWFWRRTHTSPDGRTYGVAMRRRFPRSVWRVTVTDVSPGTLGRDTTTTVADMIESKDRARLEMNRAIDAIRTGRPLEPPPS